MAKITRSNYLVAHETINAVLTFKIVDDFHLTWNGVGLCRFLLAINSNIGRISHRFRYIAIFRWKRIFFLPLHALDPPPLLLVNGCLFHK